ncbi:MAG: hypothetical protein ACXWKM_11000 [Phenylobacterium sp.]
MIDWEQVRFYGAGTAVFAFNTPIAIATVMTVRAGNVTQEVGQALKEKAPDGTSTGDNSYSRVTGLVGAIMLASLFWIVSNIIIVLAIVHPADVTTVLNSVGKLFLVGAALFVPYAFNQLKSVLQ